MTLLKSVLASTTAFGLLAGAAFAEPALIFDLGGKFDKSFNEAAYNGAERWAKETGGTYKELEMQSEAQREQALRRLAETGANPIVMTGFAFGEVLNKIAPDYPDTKFVLIDQEVKQPNVQSIVFAEEQGSYLAGIMAANASKSGTVGFIGGMDVPLIRRFQCGYEQGAKYANPKAETLSNMTGTTPAAWSDPTRGGELARNQFSRGVDVIFAAAGGTGVGVYQAAKDQGRLAIGVDSNQNHLHPGTMLTSMVKRVDVAVFNIARSVKDNRWQSGVQVLGLKENGVALAMDEHNAKRVTPEMRKRLDAAQADIVAGRIKVADYMADNACRY